MERFGNRLLQAIREHPGATDRSLTDLLFDTNTHPSQVNQEARYLENKGLMVRNFRDDGRIGNYPSGAVKTFECTEQLRTGIR